MIIYENNKPAASEQIGIKACSLLHLQKIGIETPEWFALSSDCFHDFIYDHREEYFDLINDYSEDKRQRFVKILERTDFTDSTKRKIITAIHKHFSPEDKLAIRTSITDAELNEPYIGMYQTYLFVKQNDKLFTYLKKCILSCFTEKAMSYRHKKQLLSRNFGTAIIIQKMIDPDYSGIIFTTNPRTNNANETLITITLGISHRDSFTEDNSIDVVIDKNGDIKTDLIREKIVLSRDLVTKLYRMGQTIENSFDQRVAHDIEFIVKDDKIYIMQTRPMADYLHIDKNKTHTILDSSMLSEGIKGITTPLTYTLARSAFVNTQTTVLQKQNLPADTVRKAVDNISHSICFYENRIYMRPLDLNKVTALYEQRETRKIIKKLKIMREKKQLTLARLKIEREIENENFEQLTRPYINTTFKGYTNIQLLETGHDLEAELLNDFIAQIADNRTIDRNYERLLNLAENAKIFEPKKKLDSILYSPSSVESAKDRAFHEIIKEIKRDERLVNLFTNSTVSTLVEKLHANSLLIFSKINGYINEFGTFGKNELKLEAITAKEDPAPLILEIKNQLISLQKPAAHEPVASSFEPFINKFRNIQRTEIKNLLETTKYLIDNRRALYYKQVRLCSILRSIYLRIGNNFTTAGIIHNPRDIFFLKKDEISDIIEKGKYTNEQIQERILERQTEYIDNAKKPDHECMHFYGAIQPENMIVYKSE